MVVYIIRHGETDLNTRGCLAGRMDVPLNENGKKLASVTGEALKDIDFDLIITSPLIRARSTAEIVAAPSEERRGIKLPVIEDPGLIEISFGEWEGRRPEKGADNSFYEEYKTFFMDPFSYKGAPGGETIPEVIERTDKALQDILNNKEYTDKTILIATHGCALRGMLNRFYEDRNNFWQDRVPYNCTVNIIEVKDGKQSLTDEDVIYYDRSLCLNSYKKILK